MVGKARATSKARATKTASNPIRVVTGTGHKPHAGNKPLLIKTYRLRDLSPEDQRVQIAAARLRKTLDERLGRPTPADVTALAKKKS